jgi:beta-glucanase (GH16 family)
MEFLSSQFDVANNSFPVNLVIQSAQSAQQGYVSKSSGDFIVANLPFNPTTGFHEYRIDFVPGRVFFYADGHNLATIFSSAVPIRPGHLILTQWSNGNHLWSAGPPESDAVMTVAYVKSYFNSSLSSRQNDFQSRCLDPSAAGAICIIPDQTIAPDPDGLDGNITANTYFFSNHYNMTDNQTVYHQNSASILCNVLLPIYTFIIVMIFLDY